MADLQKKTSNLNAYVHEDLSGIRVIQSFAAERETRAVFYDLVKQHYQAFIDAVVVADGFYQWWRSPGARRISAVFYRHPHHRCGRGRHRYISRVFYLYCHVLESDPNLANFYNKLTTNISAAERIFDIIDTEAGIRDCEGAEELPDIEGTVDFEHVSFAYDDEPERMILKDVNFHIRQGRPSRWYTPRERARRRL